MNSTKDIKVPDKIVDQVIGQEEAVRIIRKAAHQRRHVLLIGDPGTGKSMMGIGLAELLPQSELKDILALPNPNDENNPQITELPAGKGRDEVKKYSIDARQVMKNNNFLLFIVAMLTFIAPWWIRYKYHSDLMFTAFFLGGMLFLAAFSIMLSMGPRMFKMGGMMITPKVIVDNFGKKAAPFFDATGAHAGALLGDVLHDPFQTFFPLLKINKVKDGRIAQVQLKEELDTLFIKHQQRLLKTSGNNYEAIHLPTDELVVLGETNGLISPVQVLSSNRYVHDGEMIKLTTSENKELILTPEHQVAVWRDGKIKYVEAQHLILGDQAVAQAGEIVIDELDIIATYDEHQQEQCALYYQYLDLKAKNPAWGHKRIAKAMNQPLGKTRWWHEQKHLPVPIQTAQWLKERGLLPLKVDHPKLRLLSKVLGATFGDGGIFQNLNGMFLSSSEKEAVEEFGHDLENLFGLDHDENSRIIEGGGYGHSWCYQNTNRNVIRFFIALGAPRGNKTKMPIIVPGWIKLQETAEAEFYGSFLGGELGTPIIHKNGNYLTTLEVGITGIPQFRENRLSFLNDLSNYLKKNHITTTSIYEGKYKTEGSIIFRLLIEKKLDNVLLFLTHVKINYCTYKVHRLYTAVGQWALLKKNKYHELTNRGYGAEHAMKVLHLTPNSLYLLLNHFGPPEEATA